MALVSSPPPVTSQTAVKIASSHRPVATPPFAPRFSRLHRRPGLRCHCSSQARKNLDHIPKQFRQENLADGLMDNYKNVPECMYGLTHQQMNMFMEKDNILTRQAANVTLESITSAASYGSFLNTSLDNNARVTMCEGIGYPDEQPPDLPSHLLDIRTVFLTMPLYEAVSELIVAQMLYLDFENSSKPIFLLINSTGTQDENMEIIGGESAGFAIADTIDYCTAKVHTINIGVAYGAAALILSRGDKGNRLVLPNSLTRLHLPKTFKINGPTTDMWLQVKDLEANADAYLDMLSDVVSKPKEEIAKDIRHGRFFDAKEAIEYGLADRIIHSVVDTSIHAELLERQARHAMLGGGSKARSGHRGGPPSGFGLG